MNNTASNRRIWLYQVNRLLSQEEQDLLNKEMQSFINQWAAHGTPLKSSTQILYHSILVFEVDQNHETASGCSIDRSVRFVKELGEKYGFNAFDRNIFAYLKDERIAFTSIQESSLAKGSKVFNLALTNSCELENNFLINFEDSAWAKLAIDNSFKFSL